MTSTRPPITRRARNILFGVALGAILVASSLALVEGALRIFGLSPTDGLGTVTRTEFERVPGLFSPSQSLVDRRNPSLPHRTTINSLGYRGPEFARRKPAGEFRILFIGDSFVYGDFVNDDETMPAQLEGHLSRACRMVRVVNAGLPGSTIVDQQKVLARGLTISPDLVLLSFTENDVSDLRAEPLWDGLTRNREAKSRFPLSIVYPVVRRWALWNALLRLQGRFRATQQASARRPEPEVPSGPSAARQPGPTAQERALRERYSKMFGQMAADLAARRIAFVFTAFPAHLTVMGNWSTEQVDWVHQMAETADVESVPLLDPLRRTGKSERELYLLPFDGHPSGLGYGVAAAELTRALVRQPVLRDRCSSGP